MLEELSTPRTRLRPFTLADAPAAFAWLSDPEVMQFIPGGPDATVADVERRLTRYLAHQQQHGFSKWAIVDAQTQDLIGDAGLFHFPDGVRIELGFRLRRDRWGQGLAAEVARAWMAWFQQHHPDRLLHAVALPEHQRSQRVLTRLRFHPVGEEILYGHRFCIFALAAPASGSEKCEP